MEALEQVGEPRPSRPPPSPRDGRGARRNGSKRRLGGGDEPRIDGPWVRECPAVARFEHGGQDATARSPAHLHRPSPADHPGRQDVARRTRGGAAGAMRHVPTVFPELPVHEQRTRDEDRRIGPGHDADEQREDEVTDRRPTEEEQAQGVRITVRLVMIDRPKVCRIEWLTMSGNGSPMCRPCSRGSGRRRRSCRGRRSR